MNESPGPAPILFSEHVINCLDNDDYNNTEPYESCLMTKGRARKNAASGEMELDNSDRWLLDLGWWFGLGTALYRDDVHIPLTRAEAMKLRRAGKRAQKREAIARAERVRLRHLDNAAKVQVLRWYP